ncbi:MAG: SPFH domain-containing protein [Clostridiales bacterium]|nr:SPFH domain-containing protein [Clostridiales bacterium]
MAVHKKIKNALFQVVKFDGTPDVFAWKYPDEELGTWTQLIVNESQEAIIFKGGQALDVFGPGRHTLETKNIPILNKIINLPFGGRSPFTAEIWYINKVYNLDIKWGTPTPIQLQDAKYNIFIPVRSFGQFGIVINDAKKFLVKLVGTLPYFDSASIINYFKGLYITKVKDSISSYLINKQISIMEINAYIDELSQFMHERIKPTMDEFGIELVNFFVSDISVSENDPAVKKLKESLAKKAEMDIIGFNYQQERSFDTLETAAGNEGSGSAQLMGAGMGLGMGVGLGGAMGGQMGGIAQVIDTSVPAPATPAAPAAIASAPVAAAVAAVPTAEPEQKACPSCGKANDKNSRFCVECGTDTTINPDDIVCGGCEARIAKGTKFCPECGERLAKVCQKCDAELSENVKFCPECGEKAE